MDTATATRRYTPNTKLRSVLDEQGRKRAWLARKAGVSESLIRFLLADPPKRTVGEPVAERIALALGVPLFLVFDGTDVPTTGAPAPMEVGVR